ncbi:MAG: nucleotidyltransferase domain-containing protein [Planctomycetes bacterium]|nr:nucleotidyltransferase domain-containing protein [Planctomycetota bacterium]
MTSAAILIEAVRGVLAEAEHVRWAYVFGSVARGEDGRDVDVAIMPAATMPPGAVAVGLLVSRLEAATGRKVDLVDLGRADLPFVGPMLLERLVVLDRDPDARHGYEAKTTSRWLDFKPSHEQAQRIRTLAMQQRLQGER